MPSPNGVAVEMQGSIGTQFNGSCFNLLLEFSRRNDSG